MTEQGELFPELLAPGAVAAPQHEAAAHEAASVLLEGLPDKATTTVPEAAAFLGVSKRQVEYLVSDGTLLAAYASRSDAAARLHARPIVRSARPYDAARTKFLTLEELRLRRSNVGL